MKPRSPDSCAVVTAIRSLPLPKMPRRLQKRRSALPRNASRKLRSRLPRLRPPHRKKRQRTQQLKKVQKRRRRRMRKSPRRKKM